GQETGQFNGHVDGRGIRRFDYIVVGGGIGGLVVASRLSEDADKNVLLIEAGADRRGDPRIDTPGLMGAMYGNPDFDWSFTTVPQVIPPSPSNPLHTKISGFGPS